MLEMDQKHVFSGGKKRRDKIVLFVDLIKAGKYGRVGCQQELRRVDEEK